ncbi:MAG TPA: DUF5989 family protein [Candidatus Brocadiia bacterium]|nr:DUF5989 family protein [Candidatus Brocadiia bacterium]
MADSSEIQKDAQKELNRLAESRQPGFMRELVDLVLHNKKWWMIPIIVVLLLGGLLVIATSSSASALIYALF